MGGEHGLAEFPEREDWSPGAAGLTLHTLVSDPDDPSKVLARHLRRGCLRDRGWGAPGTGATACRMPRPAAITITPPHRGTAKPGIACTTWSARALPSRGRHALPAEPPRHMAQPRWRAHLGRYRQGLPSTFGFPIAVHPHDPDTIWVVPLNGDSAGRYPPGASAAVWVSNDGGETWSAQHSGLPTKNCYFTVLRQAMATDRQPRPGVYFGTNTGRLRLHSTGARPGTRSPDTCRPFWGWRRSRPARRLAVLLHAPHWASA
jgi:hypothetical protein